MSDMVDKFRNAWWREALAWKFSILRAVSFHSQINMASSPNTRRHCDLTRLYVPFDILPSHLRIMAGYEVEMEGLNSSYFHVRFHAPADCMTILITTSFIL